MRRGLVALLALLVLLLGAAAVALLVGRATTGAYALATARERWQARQLERYELVGTFAAIQPRRVLDIHCRHSPTTRQQQQYVAGQAVQGCALLHMSVDHLFDKIAYYQTDTVCTGRVGCECHSRFVVQARYHPTLGYPEHIVVRLRAVGPHWQHPDYWRYLWQHQAAPTCQSGGGQHVETIRVKELRPLP
jgi:hypothetical protein